ncbi:MAG: DUF523 domain-containing protein, partial [Candidatus Gracilibacteria bacterium]|nr:DUF523 domain-containing protein [Candidatus Gracilibacteria bacterium]MDD2908998.1 DUF523 domain-containing protein [Candidatus Gracilibacteria bacterium]
AGLGVPRLRSEKRGTNIITETGEDVTQNFLEGALEALEIAKDKKCKLAILKSKSPSCGCGLIYDGTFRGILTEGDGILTKLLKDAGIKVITENGINTINFN